MGTGNADISPLRKEDVLGSILRRIGYAGRQAGPNRVGVITGVGENVEGTGLLTGFLNVFGEDA